MRYTPFGHRQGTTINGVWTPTDDAVANAAALAAADPTQVVEGDVVLDASGNMWSYNPNATATDSTSQLVVPTTNVAGAFIRLDKVIDLAFAIGFATADATALFTVPVGCALLVRRGYWHVSASFTGGASSAIGLNSSDAAYNTKGDLQGGAAGDVAAALVAGGPVPGTIGAKVAAGAILVAGDTVVFNRITSAFTAGAGFAHLVCELLFNPGI